MYQIAITQVPRPISAYKEKCQCNDTYTPNSHFFAKRYVCVVNENNNNGSLVIIRIRRVL